MARRFEEQTLHTGRVAYLYARGLTELDFPVLLHPMEERYSHVVARWPVEDEGSLFYRIWEPSRTMRLVATDTFGRRYSGRPEYVGNDEAIWDAIWRIHRLASMATQKNRQQAAQFIYRASQSLSRRAGVFVSPVSLGAVAEVYAQWGVLALPHPMTASVVGASLLLMLGVPRERVAVLGMYYQDPTVYGDADGGWYAGFMSGKPFYTVLGVFVRERWTLVDLTLMTEMASNPRHHLRHPSLGRHPETGDWLIIDYAHPYTMVFAPAVAEEDRSSPLLARIPLIVLPGWPELMKKLKAG